MQAWQGANKHGANNSEAMVDAHASSVAVWSRCLPCLWADELEAAGMVQGCDELPLRRQEQRESDNGL